MRIWTKRTVAGAMLAAVLVLAASRPASAALAEKPVIDGINDNVAVLRYLHRQVADAESNLEMVRAVRELTERQYAAQKNLYDAEIAKGGPMEDLKTKQVLNPRARFFYNRLARLERQLSKLNQFNFDKIYTTRIADLKTQIAAYTVDLDARMTEYEVLFGKKAVANISFEKEMAQYKPKRADIAWFLDLDR